VHAVETWVCGYPLKKAAMPLCWNWHGDLNQSGAIDGGAATHSRVSVGRIVHPLLPLVLNRWEQRLNPKEFSFA